MITESELTSFGYQKLENYWVKPVAFSVFVFNDINQIIRTCFIGANGSFLTWSLSKIFDLNDLRWYEYGTDCAEEYVDPDFKTLMNNVKNNMQEVSCASDTILGKLNKIQNLVDAGNGESEDTRKLISELSVLIPSHSKLHQIDLEIQRLKLMKRFSKV